VPMVEPAAGGWKEGGQLPWEAATRVQPEGAASLVGRQEGKGAASVAGGVECHTATLSVWAACGVRGIGTCAPRPLWDLPANLSNLALLATVQTVRIECQHSWGEGNDPAMSFGVHEGRW
jgi:hypothetical protein